MHASAACKDDKVDIGVGENNVRTPREDSQDAATPGWADPGEAIYTQPPADLSGVHVPLGSVVKVFTVSVAQNYFLPWQSHGQRELTGSGFVIEGKRIMTNAHVVDDHAFVLVRKHGHPTKTKAKVEAVSHECDLAILRVDEDSDFWTGLAPLELASEGELPLLHENVSVVGYPSGGDSISVTGGVVSRMELIQYTFGGTNLLAIQIDAAINPGNSGGPVFLENKVVGVAFQCLPDADNIGYIIPIPVVRRFLADVAINGEPKGFCAMGIRCQSLESHQLRRYLKMSPHQAGVLVTSIEPQSTAAGILQRDDVILSFEGIPLANDGSVPFAQSRITFDYLVSMKLAGSDAALSVLRDGRQMDVSVKVDHVRSLVPRRYHKLPSYYIYGGLVFTPLTLAYLHEWGADWFDKCPRRLGHHAQHTLLQRREDQLVVLSQVLTADVNTGYRNVVENLLVESVNGVPIRNLRHLRQLVESCQEQQVRFDLEQGRVVVIYKDDAERSAHEILSNYRIPEPMSRDLYVE